jgi:RNA processing factor Prp31
VTDDIQEDLQAIIVDEEKTQQVLDAAKISMGQEINEQDKI